MTSPASEGAQADKARELGFVETLQNQGRPRSRGR
jgi:hypothetical protein